MDYTSRMTALLTAFRRERNGAVADAMRLYGAPYGLNYGVSLPTVRAVARAEGYDHDFARYLYRQDVRCLRLAALHIADPQRLAEEEFEAWATGIVNSEVAEEAAFALLCRAERFPQLFDAWITAPNPLLQYAALLGAARHAQLNITWLEPAIEAIRKSAKVASVWSATSASSASSAASLPVAKGAVALLVALGLQSKENRSAVIRATGSLGKLPAADLIHEELAWRLLTE